jgi:hypothetical protein
VSSLAARLPDLFGRAERSSPNAAWRRAEGAGLCVGHDRQLGESPVQPDGGALAKRKGGTARDRLKEA